MYLLWTITAEGFQWKYAANSGEREWAHFAAEKGNGSTSASIDMDAVKAAGRVVWFTKGEPVIGLPDEVPPDSLLMEIVDKKV